MSSWIGTAPNKTVSNDQIKSTINSGEIKNPAVKSGISEENLLSNIKNVLPDNFY